MVEEFKKHQMKQHLQAGLALMKSSSAYDQRDEIYLHRYCHTFGMTKDDVVQVQRIYPKIKTREQCRDFLRELIRIIDQRYTPYVSESDKKAESTCTEIEKLLMYRNPRKQRAFNDLVEWMDVADVQWTSIRPVVTKKDNFASTCALKRYRWSIVRPRRYTDSKLSSGVTTQPCGDLDQGTRNSEPPLCSDGKDRLM